MSRAPRNRPSIRRTTYETAPFRADSLPETPVPHRLGDRRLRLLAAELTSEIKAGDTRRFPLVLAVLAAGESRGAA